MGKVMRVLSFLINLGLLYHYPPYIQNIAREVDEFHLCYLTGKLEDENIILHKLHLPNLGTFSVPLAFATALEAMNICRKHKIDLIYVHDGPYYELSGYLTSIFARLPWVLRLRTNEIKLRTLTYKNSIRRHASNLLTKYAMKKADLLICLSHELKELALSLGIGVSKVSIVYHGVDANKFKPMNVKKPYPKVVLYVGGISRAKGILDLLKVAGILKDIHFLLLGGIAMEMPEMPENVHYLGVKPHSETPKYYNMGDILVSTSYSEGGIPDTILEAFACEKPVIATRVGEAPYVVTSKCGWLIEPGNVQELYESIREAFSDEKKLRTMSMDARKYVSERFTWKRYSQEIIKNLNAVLRK
jgi:glycosyltransferase involved in cell wall biosynthesis